MATQQREDKKDKSNSVKLLNSKCLDEAKIIVIKRNYQSLQEYVTQAVEEKNKREK